MTTEATTRAKNLNLKKLLFSYETNENNLSNDSWRDYWKIEYDKKATFIDSIGENDKPFLNLSDLSHLTAKSPKSQKSNRSSFRSTGSVKKSSTRSNRDSLKDAHSDDEVYNELEKSFALYQTGKSLNKIANEIGEGKDSDAIPPSPHNARTLKTYTDEKNNEDIGNEIFSNRDRPVHLSRNLVEALQLEHVISDKLENITTDWKAPSQYGLENSQRIIKDKTSYYDEKHNNDGDELNSKLYKPSATITNDKLKEFKDDSDNLQIKTRHNIKEDTDTITIKNEHSLTQHEQLISNALGRGHTKRGTRVGVGAGDSTTKLHLSSSAQVNQRRLSASSYSSSYDEDDDEIYFSNERPVNMCKELLNMLGIESSSQDDADSEKLATADWTPPSRHGLDNSSRVMIQSKQARQTRLNRLSNYDYKQENVSHTIKNECKTDEKDFDWKWDYDDDSSSENGETRSLVLTSSNLRKALKSRQ